MLLCPESLSFTKLLSSQVEGLCSALPGPSLTPALAQGSPHQAYVIRAAEGTDLPGQPPPRHFIDETPNGVYVSFISDSMSGLLIKRICIRVLEGVCVFGCI